MDTETFRLARAGILARLESHRQYEPVTTAPGLLSVFKAAVLPLASWLWFRKIRKSSSIFSKVLEGSLTGGYVPAVLAAIKLLR